VIVRALSPDEVASVDVQLPLNRLDQEGDSEYLVAWQGDAPVGHARLAWSGHGGLPEIQDVFVLPAWRRQGIASALTAAAEEAAVRAGYRQIGLTVSVENPVALRLYRKLGYMHAGGEPMRISGTIVIRGRPVKVDDTLAWLVKDL
jgi:ribosomal protein S18 acetylase RimI-like enzyme